MNEFLAMQKTESQTEDVLYKRIFFEKNIYNSMGDYLKNFRRIYIVTSPTPRKQYLQFLVNILNEKKIIYWVTVLNSHPICDKDTLLKTCAKVNGADLIVAFGAGTIADIVKLTATQLQLPYCVIPTTISHYGLFNDIAYIFEDNIPKLTNAKLPEKVFVDESLIKKSPERFITSSICFVISLVENLFVAETKRRILNECAIDNYSMFKKIQKTESLVNWVALSKNFALLNLMDYIIDLSEICKSNYDTNAILYALSLNSSTLRHNFGEKCLLTSTVLLNLYSSFFEQKEIMRRDIPDMDKIIKNYSRKYKDKPFFLPYMANTEKFLDKNLCLALNNSNLVEILTEFKSFISKFAKKIIVLNSSQSKLRMIDENELYSCLELLPFIYDNTILNILTRYGYMNVS